MDYHCMNRKQLQALCKRHGVPANLSNREMAEWLSSIFKENKPVSSKKSSTKKKASVKKSSEKVSKVVKKVRFSPENETFIYEISGCRRPTRRTATVKSLSKKQSQVVENEVCSPPTVRKKRARRDVKDGTMKVKSAVECDDNGNGGLNRRQLRSRRVRVERDLVVSRKNMTRRSLEMVKNENEVSEDNAVDGEDAKLEKISEIGGRTTRSRALVAMHGTESCRILRQTKRSVTKVECSELVSGNSRQVKGVERSTRSRAKIAGKASAATSKTEDTYQLEEPSKGLGRFASRRKSVVVEKGKLESDEIGKKKQVKKRSRNNDVEVASELDATEEPCKAFEEVKNVRTRPSRRTRRDISIISTEGELEADQNVGQKNVSLTEKPLRRSSRNAAAGAEPQKVLQEQKGKDNVKKEEDSRNSKRFKSINRITRSQSKSAEEASAEESETVMFKSTVSIDRELEAHQIVGQADDFTKDHEKRSNRNASRNHLSTTSSKGGGIPCDGEMGGPQKRSQEQIQDEDTKMSKRKTLAEQPLRRSARNTSQVNLVEPAAPTGGEVLEKKHPSRSRMTSMVEEVPSSDNLSAPEELPIIDVRLSGSESGSIKNNLDANGSGQVLESSCKKRKTHQGRFSEENQPSSAEVPTINSDIENTVDTSVNCDLEVIRMKNNAGNLFSSEMTDGLYPANQLDDLAEPSNIDDMGAVLEAEEPSMGKNKNHGSDDVDDHSNKDDGTLVQEFDSLVQLEDAKETAAEPVIQEAFSEEHLNEPSSEKKSETSQDEAEEINAIDPFVGEAMSHSENFLGAIQLQELTAESHLLPVETVSGRTTEIQLISGGANVTEASPCKPILESEDNAGFDNKMNNSPVHVLIASNDALAEVNKGETQNVLQSTMLEISDKNCIGQYEFSGKGTDLSNEIICRGETTKSEPEETFHNEIASQIGEKTINEGYEENLSVDSSSIPFSIETDAKDVKNKENGVSAGHSQDAVEKESEVSEQEPGSVPEESRGNSIHEIFDEKETSLPIIEEKGTDVEQNTLVASINLQSAGTVDKGSLPNGQVSSIETKSSSCKGKLSTQINLQEKLKEKPNEDTEDGLNIEGRAESLTQFALEEWQDEGESDTPDANNTSGKFLCQLTGDCDTVKITEVQVSVDGSCGKAFPLDGSAAVNSSELVWKNIRDHADLEGERNCTADIIVEQCPIIVKEQDAESALNIELAEKCVQKDVASQVNDTASTSLTGIISKDIKVPNEIAVDATIKRAGCIKGVDNLKMEEFKADEKNSDAEDIDVNALAQVSSNHLVEEDVVGSHNVSVGSTGIAAEGKTKTMAMKRMEFLGETENGETLVTDSPVIQVKTFKGEFEDNNRPAPGFLNEFMSANCEDLSKRPNEVVGTVPHDEAKFVDLDNFTAENVLKLGRSASVTSDNLISVNSIAATEKENVGAVVETLSFKDNSSDVEKEDNVDAITQVTKTDIDDHLLEVGSCNANENDNVFLNYGSPNIRVAANDAGEVSMNAKICSQNIEDDTECFEKTPTSSQKIKSGRKWGEKSSAEGKFCAGTSFDKPEMGSSAATFSHSSVIPFPGSDAMSLRDQKDCEGSKDSIHDFDKEDNARTPIEQFYDFKVALAESVFINGSDCPTSREHSCSNRRKSTAQVAEEGVLSEKRFDMAVTADIEKLYDVSSLTPRMSADCSAFSPIIVHSNYGITENKSLEFHVDSPRLTSWEMNRIFGSGDQVDVQEVTGVISEANLMTQDHEDAVEKENLMTKKQVDQQATEKQLVEQEHHTHLAVSDEPFYNNESSEKNGLSAINQEFIDSENPMDKLYAASEKVVLTEVAATSGRRRIPREVLVEQADEPEGAATEATSVDNVNPCAVETVEANGLHCFDDEVVAAGDSKEVEDLESLNVAFILEPEMAVDRCVVSSVKASSNSEVNVESHISTVREMNASGPGEQDKIENSDGGALETTNTVSEDAREVKEEVTITEKVTPQVTEQEISEHEMAEEVPELKSILPSDPIEPTCESGKGSREQEDTLAIIQCTPGDKNDKNESSKFDSTNSATVRDTAVEGARTVELSLLRPRNKSPVAKTGVHNLLAKRLNSSISKQNNRSTLMQRTTIQLAHDMKENVLSNTKTGKTGNITAQKTFSNRRALQDLHKK